MPLACLLQTQGGRCLILSALPAENGAACHQTRANVPTASSEVVKAQSLHWFGLVSQDFFPAKVASSHSNKQSSRHHFFFAVILSKPHRFSSLVQGVAMSTSAVSPFRSFVQTPIFSVSPSSFSSSSYSNKHHHHPEIVMNIITATARSTLHFCHAVIKHHHHDLGQGVQSGYCYHRVHASPLLPSNAHILRLTFEL